MLSVNSSFNKTLFSHNIRRFWPLWFAMTLFWFTTYPANIFFQRGYYNFGYGDNLAVNWANDGLPGITQDYTASISLLVGLIAAMVVFSYLFSGKSANTIHALPVRREGLFLTNYLSGLALMYIPLVVNFGLSLVAHGIFGGLNLANLALWLVAQMVALLFFFSFAVFCAMFTGQILALPLFYVILNFLVPWCTVLVQELMSTFLYGYSYASTPDWLAWLCPTLQLDNILKDGYEGYLVIFGVAGLVLAGLSLLLYRRRHLERAGDVVVVLPVYPIFRTGVALCSGLLLGSLFFALFQDVAASPEGLFMGLFALWGVVGYFVAEMFLRKSFRVLSAWKGGLVTLAILLVAGAGMTLDLTGYEDYVPSGEDVAEVQITGLRSYPSDVGYLSQVVTDPDLVEQVLDIHTLLTQSEGVEGDEFRYCYLTYILNDGTTICRGYGFEMSHEDLENPQSLASLVEQFHNEEAILEAYYSLDELAQNLADGTLVEATIAQTNATSGNTLTVYNQPEEVASLAEAVLADFAEGNFGARYLFSEDAYKDELAYQEISFYTRPAQSEFYLEWTEEMGDYEIADTDYAFCTIALTSQSSHTLDWLG